LSCPVTGDGTGGRNQAFVLDCVYKIAGQPVVVLSGGTDGIDGNSPACGAIADGESLARAGALGIEPEDYRMRSDSYHFFERLGDAIVTGPTGTNVRDLRMLLAY
jgi:hydroxypyruvate reductase